VQGAENPLTIKGHKRQEIARWAILAQWPDCRDGFYAKGAKVTFPGCQLRRSIIYSEMVVCWISNGLREFWD
jgi:hypothetical protein